MKICVHQMSTFVWESRGSLSSASVSGEFVRRTCVRKMASKRGNVPGGDDSVSGLELQLLGLWALMVKTVQRLCKWDDKN